MYRINKETQEITVSRGDAITIGLIADNNFKPNDIIRLCIYEQKKPDNVLKTKSITINEETNEAIISLSKEDTSICEITNKPISYWYDITLNPDTTPQTLIGYDLVNGVKKEKLFTILPKGDC